MDNEQMEKIMACKSADEAKALLIGKRQLKDAEMEQVVGGAVTGYGDGWVEIDGKRWGKTEFNAMFILLTKNVGYNSAVEALRDSTGFFCREMTQVVERGSGVDVTLMGTVLTRFWEFYGC